MSPLITNSPDGTPIAYDRSGTGPALILLHGGGSGREAWQEAGYIERLRHDFTVITPDLRGHGDSGMPIRPSDYTADKMLQDILAVANACRVEQFTLWGFSFGGKVGRYVAAHSERVNKIVLMGTPLGPYISSEFRKQLADFNAHWNPILDSRTSGRLDLAALSGEDHELLAHKNVPAMMAWGQAMLDWPAVEPAEILCPALWLVGSEDTVAMITVRQYQRSLNASKVQLHIVEGLNHGQIFGNIDRVLATMLAFTRSGSIL